MLTFIQLIPSEGQIRKGEALNVLGGAVNHGKALTADIYVWGRICDEWKLMKTIRTEIGEGEHKHIYVTLEAALFSKTFWGEEIEEIELCMHDKKPSADHRGVIVFIS